jgi:hypothetical protein
LGENGRKCIEISDRRERENDCDPAPEGATWLLTAE